MVNILQIFETDEHLTQGILLVKDFKKTFKIAFIINLLHLSVVGLIFNIDVFIWLSELDNIYHAKCVFTKNLLFNSRPVSFQSCKK